MGRRLCSWYRHGPLQPPCQPSSSLPSPFPISRVELPPGKLQSACWELPECDCVQVYLPRDATSVPFGGSPSPKTSTLTPKHAENVCFSYFLEKVLSFFFSPSQPRTLTLINLARLCLALLSLTSCWALNGKIWKVRFRSHSKFQKEK